MWCHGELYISYGNNCRNEADDKETDGNKAYGKTHDREKRFGTKGKKLRGKKF
jgi:hypothetical protein